MSGSIRAVDRAYRVIANVAFFAALGLCCLPRALMTQSVQLLVDFVKEHPKYAHELQNVKSSLEGPEPSKRDSQSGDANREPGTADVAR